MQLVVAIRRLARLRWTALVTFPLGILGWLGIGHHFYTDDALNQQVFSNPYRLLVSDESIRAAIVCLLAAMVLNRSALKSGLPAPVLGRVLLESAIIWASSFAATTLWGYSYISSYYSESPREWILPSLTLLAVMPLILVIVCRMPVWPKLPDYSKF